MAGRGQPSERRGATTVANDSGVRLIMLYKFVRGGLAALVSVVVVALLLAGKVSWLEGIGPYLDTRFTGAWSVSLAKVLIAATEPRHLWLAAIALGLDGAMTIIEGWALHHGHAWGPWLVVITTSSLLPFELISLAKHPHWGRFMLLVANVAIVAYLVQRALAHRPRTEVRPGCDERSSLRGPGWNHDET